MTLIQFVPPTNQAFFFSPTLNGQTFLAVVPWCLFGVRWYFELNAPSGELLFSKALIGSPDGLAIESMTWANGYVVATTAVPHGYKITDTIRLSVVGCVPVEYNGIVDALITKPSEFIYPFPRSLGAATTLGLVNYDVNLVEGYVANSTLVFRTSSQQFEVTP